jgi:putative FmdB family regulatory protein
MPLLEYQCTQCGSDFEKLISYQQADNVDCPTCHHPQAHRKLSRVAIHVQGSSVSQESSEWSNESSCSTGTCCAGGTCGLV